MLSRTVMSFVFCVCLAGVAFAGGKDAQCYWTNAEMKIDGKTQDWQLDKGAFFAEQKAVISTCNDKAFLYVLFRTNDIGVVRTIKMNGITFYFDRKGGSSKKFSLHYRGGPDLKQLMQNQEQNIGAQPMHSEWQHPPEGMNHPDSSFAQPRLVCNIDDWLLDKEIPFDGTLGPNAAFDTSQGFYSYEFRIPLTEASVRYYGIGAEAGQKVSVGALWGGMTEKKKGKPQFDDGFGDFGGNSGMPPPGGGMGGGRMGGGMGSGGRKPPFGDSPMMIKKQEIWVKAVIAPFSAPAQADATAGSGK